MIDRDHVCREGATALDTTIRNLLLVVLGFVVLAANGCRHSSANDSTGPSVSVQPDGNEDRVIGCHPVDAVKSGDVPVEPSLATAGGTGMMTNEMVLVKGGNFFMGTNDGMPTEGPAHEVIVRSFWIDQHEVTAAQFSDFVSATGYKSDAEKFGWGGVFEVRTGAWKKMDGADWRHPDGPASSAVANEPVTQVSWNDAVAYASWAGKRLPTEAEFEYAARGGLSRKTYAWGNELTPGGRYLANWWQGSFPSRNLGQDGFIGRARVGSFAPNGYQLYDMTGNVWEWCADWFGDGYYNESPRENPRGPTAGETRVIRGGSWLCSDNYCSGYRVAARNQSAPDSGLNNLGFRCVRD